MFKKYIFMIFSDSKLVKYFLLTLFCIIFIGTLNFGISFALQKGIDFALQNDKNNMYVYMSVFIVLSLVFGVCLYCKLVYNEKITQRITKKVSSALLEHIFKISRKEFINLSKSNIVTIFNSDVSNCGSVWASTLFPSIQLLVSFTIGAIYVGYYSKLVLVVAFLLSLILLIINVKFSPKIEKSYDELQTNNSEQVNILTDFHSSTNNIKIFSLLPFYKKVYAKIFEKRFKSNLKYVKYSKLSYLTLDYGILLIEFIVLLLLILLYRNNLITLGVVVGIWNAAIGTFVYPLIDIPGIIKGYSVVKASATRIMEIEDIKEEKVEERYELNNPEIVVENATFAYEDRPIVNNISFCVKSGDLIFIDGASGEGKTTLLKVLMKFVDLDSGTIYLTNNEQKIYEYSQYIAYVPQSNFLLKTSVKNNILMNNYLKGEDAKIEDLIKRLSLEELINSFPEKYDHVLDPQNDISIGQAQRIAIIRALIDNNSIIIMDEPFSALDNENCTELANIINEYKNNKIIIIISHRVVSNLVKDYHYSLKGGELHEK